MRQRVLGLVVVLAAIAMGQSGSPATTKEQREEVVRLAAGYPVNPTDATLDSQATAAVKMLRDAPDIPVAICPEHLPWIEKKKYKYAHELTLAYYLGSGTYAIQHAEVKPSRIYYSALLAGSEAAIRTYEVLVQRDAGARLDKMNDWIAKRQSGQLMSYLEENCAAPNPGASRPKGPTTAEERQRIIAFAEELQQNPTDPALRPEYQELFVTVVQATDFSVQLCLTPWLNDKPEYKYGPHLMGLDLMAMSSFVLRNPDAGKDGGAQNFAGLKASLRGYEAILKQEPEAHSKSLDNLLALEKEGKLESWSHDQFEKSCRSKK